MTDTRNGEDNGKLLYCSFCGKSQHEVRKLIAGPSVFICDECVRDCEKLVEDLDGTEPAGAAPAAARSNAMPCVIALQGSFNLSFIITPPDDRNIEKYLKTHHVVINTTYRIY